MKSTHSVIHRSNTATPGRRPDVRNRTRRGRYALSALSALISATAAALAMFTMPAQMHQTAIASQATEAAPVARHVTEGARLQTMERRADRWSERPATPTITQPAERYWRAPLDRFDLTSMFGARWGSRHEGLDFGAAQGADVHAAYPGRVVSAGWNDGGYGNLVIIDHGDGIETYYAHNSKVLVKPGERVRTGDHIAEVGDTGDSFGPHCHFEVRQDGTPIDPLPFLADHRVDVLALADNVSTDDGPSPY